MARSVVELLIAAKDATGDAFRSATKNLKGFLGEAGKFAAGLGIFDSFKQLGKFVFQAAQDAARMVPELAAPFDALKDRWEKTRLEIGAGALQLGAPIAKFGLDALDAIKGFVQGATEEWFKLPTRFDQVLGKLQQSLGEFLADTQVILARFGIDTGDLGERIANAGAKKVRDAIRERGDLAREFATPDTSGPTPIEQALAAQHAKEADDAQAKREGLLERVATAGRATHAELLELAAAEAKLKDALLNTNLPLERRAQLIDRQKAAQQALAAGMEQFTGVLAAPQIIDHRDVIGDRRADAARVAAAEATVQAELAQQNKTIEQRAALEAQLHDLEQQRFQIAKDISDLAANDQARAKIQQQLAAGTASLETQRDLQRQLVALETQRANLSQPQLAVRTFRPASEAGPPEQLAFAGEGDHGPNAPEAPPEAQAPPPLDNRPPELQLLPTEDQTLIPPGLGDQAAGEIDIVQQALAGLGQQLAHLNTEGWGAFGAAAENAAEHAIKAQGNVGKASWEAVKGFLAKQARAKAQDAFIHAGKALADGFLGNPAAFAAAAQYGAAGVAWSALAGQLGGGGGGSGGVAGGAGGGGSTGGDSSLGTALPVQQGTIVFKVPRRALVDASSPEFQDVLTEALSQGGQRNVVVEEED